MRISGRGGECKDLRVITLGVMIFRRHALRDDCLTRRVRPTFLAMGAAIAECSHHAPRDGLPSPGVSRVKCRVSSEDEGGIGRHFAGRPFLCTLLIRGICAICGQISSLIRVHLRFPPLFSLCPLRALRVSVVNPLRPTEQESQKSKGKRQRSKMKSSVRIGYPACGFQYPASAFIPLHPCNLRNLRTDLFSAPRPSASICGSLLSSRSALSVPSVSPW